jgi:hypothetical protein
MRNKPLDRAYGGLDSERIINNLTTVNLDALQTLYYFINERYQMRNKKDLQRLPAPWTDDPILATYRFTNVRREHDKTSAYLLQQLKLNDISSYSEKIQNIIAFRMFNKIETYEAMEGWVCFDQTYGVERVQAQLRAHTPSDGTYFTNAFLCSGMKRLLNSTYQHKADTTHERVLIAALNPAVPALIQKAKTPQRVILILKKIPGVGDFLAYQMFVDLTYLPEFPFSENEFVMCGPGCKRGLEYLYDDWGGLTPEELMFQLRDNINVLFKRYIDPDWNPRKLFTDLPVEDRTLNVMCLENCMCELHKYIKVSRGEGRPRNKYLGGLS